MIVDGIVTSTDVEGVTHVAAMGASITDTMQHIALRPFQSAQTFHNLRHRREGVFHVVDNIELLTRAAIGCWSAPPTTDQLQGVNVPILRDACRWYAFYVVSIDESQRRAMLQCRVHRHGTLREVSGFNRAKHAILELAIAATRLHLLPADEVAREQARARTIVEKTAGPAEEQALRLLNNYIETHHSRATP